jgi:SMI1 / KNR4 family (SUKH-1)
MRISDILQQLSGNLSSYDITLYRPATDQDLEKFEGTLRCPLPDDMKALYRFCNGFESAEDIFRIIPLDEINISRPQPDQITFSFAEYMIYSDMWDININFSNSNDYWISNNGEQYRRLTNSLPEFLKRFLDGGVFEKGGLYKWHEEIDQQSTS